MITMFYEYHLFTLCSISVKFVQIIALWGPWRHRIDPFHGWIVQNVPKPGFSSIRCSFVYAGCFFATVV